MSGSHSGEVASRLSEHDSAGLLAVTVADWPGTAAIVIGIKTSGSDVRAADVVLDDGQALTVQIDRLWSQRLAPFARCMAGLPLPKPGPPVLRQHNPQLLAAAERMLRRIHAGLTEGGFDDGRWTYDHIGSTAVAGCARSSSSTCRSVPPPCPRKGRRPTKSWRRPVSSPPRAPGLTRRGCTETG